MDESHHDKVFVRTFGVVLGALFALTFIIMAIAAVIAGDEPEDPIVAQRVAERLAPVGQVVTDPEMLVAVAQSDAPSEPRSGEEIVAGVCAGCHTAGVLGAPKTGDKAAWKALLDSHGLDDLVKSAIAGEGAMPPRGGDPSLSDEEVRAAVEQLLKDSGL